MDFEHFSFVINNNFFIQHCTARDGNDTPTNFVCRKGLRKWSRFFYLVKGEIYFKSHTGKEFIMKSGDILFLPFDVEYTSKWIDAESGYYYTVEFILTYPNGENIDLFNDLAVLHSDTGYFKSAFKEMAETATNCAIGWHLKIKEQFFRLLYHLSISIRKSKEPYNRVYSAVALIEQDIRMEHDTNHLASLCNMSPATFRRQFLQCTKMSPVKYRNFLRLKKANELLSTGLYTVTEAAVNVGFDDIYYFSKIYKKQFGQTPSQSIPK
ncbi:MAG: helix-turn-helix transcriptional regulator [Clostridia bacterium]|nr:helix-turn-helix transcriptional regulator [Clostridia bacterium]